MKEAFSVKLKLLKYGIQSNLQVHQNISAHLKSKINLDESMIFDQ